VHPQAVSGAGLYRTAMQGIREQYGDRHRAIITEAGLARLYKHIENPPGDVGWLYPGEPIRQEDYWRSLRWYNDLLCADSYVLGACLFQVGHSGRWETFRHLGIDNEGRSLQIIRWIEDLELGEQDVAMGAAHILVSPGARERAATLRGRILSGGQPVAGAVVRLLAPASTLGADHARRGPSARRPGLDTGHYRLPGPRLGLLAKFVAPRVAASPGKTSGRGWWSITLPERHRRPFSRLGGPICCRRTCPPLCQKSCGTAGSAVLAGAAGPVGKSTSRARWPAWTGRRSGKRSRTETRTWLPAATGLWAGETYRLPRAAGQNLYARVALGDDRGRYCFAALAAAATPWRSRPSAVWCCAARSRSAATGLRTWK